MDSVGERNGIEEGGKGAVEEGGEIGGEVVGSGVAAEVVIVAAANASSTDIPFFSATTTDFNDLLYPLGLTPPEPAAPRPEIEVPLPILLFVPVGEGVEEEWKRGVRVA